MVSPGKSSTKKTKKEQQLPEDVLFSDILVKLSAKSVLRLKPVRKSWYASIKNPKFVDRFLANSLIRPDGTALLLTTHDEALKQQYFISSTTEKTLDDRRPVCLVSMLETEIQLSVSQNINGMFCIHPPPHTTFYEASAHALYVFNPSTREYLSLPPLPNPPSNTWPGINLNMVSYFFGFDPGNKEYKVVGICCNVSNPELRVVGEVECGIFTLGESSKSWRIVNAPIPVSFNPCTSGVCVNGAIHWLVKEKRVILAFDLALEMFRLIKLDDGISITTVLDQAEDDDNEDDDGDGYDDEYEDVDMEDEYEEDASSIVWPCLIQVGSYLAVLEYDDVELRMWVLKDYQNEQWMMESMNYPYDWNLMHAMPCGSSHTGEFFLCLNHNTGSCIPKIVCCDMERSTYRWISFVEQFEKINSSTVSVSLVGCYPENIMPLPKI